MKPETNFIAPSRENSPFHINFHINFFIIFSVALMLFSGTIALLNSAAIPVSAASADIPPVSGIEILEYENSILQEAGTISTYEVKVKNIGVLDLRDVGLDAEKIPAGWFSSNATLELEFGKVGVLKYELAIPEDASGMSAFSLIVKGSYGPGVVTDIAPVVLNVLVLPEPKNTATTEVTQTTTSQPATPATTQPPIIPISKGVSDLLKFLNPENAFSKFRGAVTYVRATASGILTDETIIYKTAAALFVVVVVLVIVRKAMVGRVSVEE